MAKMSRAPSPPAIKSPSGEAQSLNGAHVATLVREFIGGRLIRKLMQRHRRIMGEAAWVFAGQGASALATLVGLRLITEVVPPAVYGAVALALGVVALAHGLTAGPIMQAVLRFYPDLAADGRAQVLRKAALGALRKPIALASGALALAGLGWVLAHPQEAWLVAFSLALFLAEVARSVEVTFLNAARRQRAMALLTTADAWLRPLAAVALVWTLGASSAAVIAGYVVGGLLALGGFKLLVRAEAPSANHAAAGIPSFDSEVARRLRAYALPLTPLPLIGWVSGQADRYLLGGMAGVEAAGLYAALYGLASKPFLMFSASVELALRQPYYARVSAADVAGERFALAVWLAVVLAGAVALYLAFWLFHAEIAVLVLAAEYRAHSALMGWIAAGYVLLAAAQVLARVCYAHHDTRGVTWVEAAAAALSLIVAVPLIYCHGIEGAAWAVPIYFGAQLLLAAGRARWAWRRAAQPVQAVTPAVPSAR